MGSSSMSSAIREMQAKPSTRWHYTPTRTAERTIQPAVPRATEDTEHLGLIHPAVGMQDGTVVWRRAWQFLERLNIHLPHNPGAPLLPFVPEKPKHVHTKTCVQRPMAALFLTAQTGNHPNVIQGRSGEVNRGLSTPGILFTDKKG